MSVRTTGRGPSEVRNTRQRRVIAEALTSLEDFISTQDLHALLRERGESVSLATTYRILQSMSELGELDVLRSDDGEAIYRRCSAEHHHHHLVCRRCGAAVELEAPAVEEWAGRTAAAHGFTEVDHTVEITGVCAACSAQDRE
ncbi:transcriptional repressor [Kocuria dechangensis]|uniref:Transcriptional repressor n=1 Tax=Kocuria dechangensis TaxID=1176249 RepID=A0A917GV18_9MICC|nr:transcriptional repressor [Kocuria dechangensis]GGG57824.1 transcriptional repressor [Kocuria dechangensis]